MIRRPSSSATSSRPSAVRPPFSMPCADPATALSKKWARPTIRNPASSIVSRSARSGPSAWAPSIASSPATSPGLSARRARSASRSAPERTSVNDPSERFAIASNWRPRWSARALRLRHVFAGQPRPRASRVMSSERSSLRSMFRCRGDFVATPNTWSATLPSISRGTSTWPRSPRRSRSRPQSSGSAWRSTTVAAAWTFLARSDTAYGGAAAIGFSRRSVRATSVRPAGTRGDRAGEGRDGRTRRDGSGPGPHVAGSRSRRRTSSSSAIRSVFVNPYRR